MKAGEKAALALGDFPQSQAAKWLQIIASGLLIPALIGGALMLISLDRRVAVIESNRWSSRDQAIYATEVDREISALARGLAARLLIADAPPEWYVAQQRLAEERMNARMDLLEALLREVAHQDGGE